MVIVCTSSRRRAGYKVIIVVDPTKRGFRGRPVYRLDPKFKRVRVQSRRRRKTVQGPVRERRQHHQLQLQLRLQLQLQLQLQFQLVLLGGLSVSRVPEVLCNKMGFKHRYLKHGYRSGSSAGRKRKQGDDAADPTRTKKKKMDQGLAQKRSAPQLQLGSSFAGRPFQCPECDKCYANKMGLYQHRYLKHGYRSGSSAGRKRKQDDDAAEPTNVQ